MPMALANFPLGYSDEDYNEIMATSTNLIEDLQRGMSCEDWLDRLDESLSLIADVTNRQKVAYLLANIGQYGYNILKSLTSPDKPSTKEYEELTNMLNEHLEPKPTTLAERYRFHQIRQGNLKVAEFLAKIRVSAGKCDYKTFYTEALRDQVIFGLSDEIMRRMLLGDEKITTVEEAYKECVAKRAS